MKKKARLCLLFPVDFRRAINTFSMPDSATDPSYPLNLARNLNALRTEGEWSMRALTDRAHLSERTLQYLERAEMVPTLSTVEKLAQALGVETGSLLGQRPVPRRSPEIFIEAIIARNLVAARKRLMLTQEQLAQQSGVSRTMIAHIEREARNPSLQTLARLAGALDLSIEGLLSK